MFRPMVVRRRPLLRAAAVGGTFAAGRAMGRRAEQADQQQQATQPAQPAEQPQQPVQQAPSGQSASGSVLDQLNKLAELHQQGALSDDEFAAAKAKVLGS